LSEVESGTALATIFASPTRLLSSEAHTILHILDYVSDPGPQAGATDQQAPEHFSNPRCDPGLTWKTLISASKTPADSLPTTIATGATGKSGLCAHHYKQ